MMGKYGKMCGGSLAGRGDAEFFFVIQGEICNEIVERFHFRFIYKLEFRYKVVKMLETGVEVGLFSEGDYLVEMAVIDVRVDSEESFVDGFYEGHEFFGEGFIGSGGEHFFVV